MKLEFSALNGLLHTALTYLCQQDCVIPGAPAVPLGTAIRLELHWPEGEQPIEVKGRSLGLDPGGRGLRLEIDDPVSLHQVVMMMTHLHFGPHVGKRLLERSGVFAKKQTQEFAESEASFRLSRLRRSRWTRCSRGRRWLTRSGLSCRALCVRHRPSSKSGPRARRSPVRRGSDHR